MATALDAAGVRVWALSALILTLGLLLGCRASPSPPPEITVPTIVGVVEAMEFTTPSTARFTLATGAATWAEVELDLETARRLRGQDSPEPNMGWLLLYGHDSKGPWFLALSEQGEGRFGLQAHGTPTEDFVTFDFGLRLPIAEHWTQGPGGAMEPGRSPFWFVNARGEVIEIPM